MSLEGIEVDAAMRKKEEDDRQNPYSMVKVILLLESLQEFFSRGEGLLHPQQEKFVDCTKAIEFLKTGSHRRRLPRSRRAVTHKFQFGLDKETGRPNKGYVTVGFFEDDEPGEIFISMAKTGSTVSGVLDCLAIVVSMALQHGVPLRTICQKLARTRFEPDGFSGEEFGFASSIPDYIFRWLEARYVVPERKPDETK